MGNNYRVLIVDDESIIRDGLLSFCWEKLGFQAAGAVSNGKKALEFMAEQSIDLVITDIKMPVMDGLALSHQIHSLYPSCKTIILSGYQDFDYARSALKSGVTEYLLKPIDLAELETLICDMYKLLEKERATAKHAKSYEKILPLAQREFLNKLVKKQGIDLSEIEEEQNLLEFPFPGTCFSCCVFRMHLSGLSEEQKQSLFDEIQSLFLAYYKEQHPGYFFRDTNNDLICIFSLPPETPEGDSKSLLKMHIKNLMELLETLHFPVPFHCAAGNVYPGLLFLCASYRQAIHSLERQFFNKTARLFLSWEEQDFGQVLSCDIPYDVENDLFFAVSNGDEAESLRLLSRFWDSFSISWDQADAKSVKEIAFQLLSSLNNHMVKFSITMKEIYGTNSLSEYLNTFFTLSSLQADIENRIRLYCEKMQFQNDSLTSTARHSVHQALKYIHTHYSEKISLEIVSREAALSPCYLSLQFKRETGQTFIEYLKAYRMKKAQELLASGNYKVYEVSPMVGYHNPKYFTDTFKSFTGLTPLEYRNKISSTKQLF